MSRFNRTTILFLFVISIGFLQTSVIAQDVILYPGWISGTVTTSLPDHHARHIAISASGGGYSSSKNIYTDSYTLTVQGGDWDYNVYASATISPEGATYPYTRVYFSNRTFPVPVGETVVNDYAASGAVRFSLSITGDSYNSWSAYSYGDKTASGGQEQTDSDCYTSSSDSSDGIWYMPVVTNDQIEIRCIINIYGSAYDEENDRNYNYTKSYTFGPFYHDISAGDLIDIPLTLEHVAPPPPPVTPPPTYDYGTLQGTVFLNMNIDGVDYSDYFRGHSFYGHLSRISMDENPGYYLREDVVVGSYVLRLRTYFREDNRIFSLEWPYTGGLVDNDRIRIEKDQTTTKDFIRDAGMLTGQLRFTGILKNEDLTYCRLAVHGGPRTYEPGSGWIYPLSYGGWTDGSWNSFDAPAINYRFFLTEGPWQPYYLTAGTQSDERGYRSSSIMNIYDYRFYYNGWQYDFGHPVDIVPGISVAQDREYCTGSVVIRVRVEGGSLISDPSVSGSASRYNEDGKQELSISVSGRSDVKNHEAPAVEIFGLPADYDLTVRATTEDGSLITFATLPITLECNVRKMKDILGPDLVIDYPPAELITNAASITVAGTASDDSGIDRVLINDVQMPQTGTPEVVTFSHDLALNPGQNSITTQAYDITGKEGSDERTVYQDPWLPTVSIVSPEQDSIHAQGLRVPMHIETSDRGYGFTLTVYLDGNPVYERSGPANETAVETMTANPLIGPITAGNHVIVAEVTDHAGNSVSDSVTIVTDSWLPTVSIQEPDQGALYNGADVIPVQVQACDQGIGFSLEVFLDGASIGQVQGPGNIASCETITFSGSVGPLDGGDHTIQAVVSDTGGNTASSEHVIHVDNWVPTINFVSPEQDGTIVGPESTVPLEIQASDQGYGFTLVVTLDGQILFEEGGPANAGAPAVLSFSDVIGPLSPGENVIHAVATDAAGNSAEGSITIYSDTWSPQVTIVSPGDGSVYTVIDPVDLQVEALDPGYGFTLRVYVADALIHEESKPGSGVTETISYHGTIGPFAPGNYTVRAEAIDQTGNSASAASTITVLANSPPSVSAGGPYTGDEGSSIPLSATGDDPENGLLVYAWDLDNDGMYETPEQEISFAALEGPMTHTVGVQVTDDGGLTATDATTVTVNNVAPTADFVVSPSVITEGEEANLSFSNTHDPSAADMAAGFLFSYDCKDDGVFEVVDSTSNSYLCEYPDNGTFTTRGRIKDKDGGFTDDTAQVVVENVPPSVGSITAPMDPVPLNTPIDVHADFSDPGVLDTHTAQWNWGDGTSSEGTVTETDGSGTVYGSHTYSISGVYTIRLTVTDKDGGFGESVFRYVVVYDASGGFVTGGGWIDSPVGAYIPDSTLTGKANFGFVSKYKKGRDIPTGQTEFNFKVANMNFHSTSYEWLVVAGPRAQYKGAGTINGAGNYGFMLTVIDSALTPSTNVDLFRIKIWDRDNGDAIVYDNQLGSPDDADPATEIGGGSIVIHKSD